jgi:hypothetical protein
VNPIAYGCFTGKDDCPDLRRAEAAVAAARSSWDALLLEIGRHTKARPAWRFYGRNYGWALAFKKAGRSLAALFPDEGRLTALTVLTGEQADAALADPELGATTRALIESLPRFKEGCWVFVRVAGEDDVAAARRLIRLRAGAATGGRY